MALWGCCFSADNVSREMLISVTCTLAASEFTVRKMLSRPFATVVLEREEMKIVSGLELSNYYFCPLFYLKYV